MWLFLQSWVFLLMASTCSHTASNLSCRIPLHRVLQWTGSLPTATEPNQLKGMAGVLVVVLLDPAKALYCFLTAPMLK